jgi:hypothetical protein
MPIDQIVPLAPAYLLLLGAVLILIAGPFLTAHRRYAAAIVLVALAALGLYCVGIVYPSDAPPVRVLVEWLDEPVLAVRVSPFEPFLWMLLLSLLAISLSARGKVDQPAPRSQALLFALTATAFGVVLAGTFRTLAFALLLFDGTAALFALSEGRPGWSIGRLLLGAVSSATVVAAAQGGDSFAAQPFDLGALFGLVVWLRVGLYSLLESETPLAPPVSLAWSVINLAVGLYLVSAGLAPWLAWLAGLTTVFHGVLAWSEPVHERALLHAGHAWAGGILTMAALIGFGPAVLAASVSALAALVVLSLIPPGLEPFERNYPQRLLAYLPPALATASVLGVPLTPGGGGRGSLYGATWEAGLPGTLAVVALAEGAALSVLYRTWRTLLPGRTARAAPGQAPGDDPTPGADGSQDRDRVWPLVGAALACIPFLIPALGPRLLLTTFPYASPAPGPDRSIGGAGLGLVGSLLWAFFLGYGRPHLLSLIPWPADTLARVLRLHWLLRSAGRTLDTVARVLLRVRALIEGEHYLAWAILFALGIVLVIVLR